MLPGTNLVADPDTPTLRALHLLAALATVALLPLGGPFHAPAVITTSYTPNVYAYELAFNGQLVDYSAAISVLLGLVTIVVAYVVQLTIARRERIL